MGEPDLSMVERRCERRCDIGNEIVKLDLGDGRDEVSCCIWNISDRGACLMVPSDLSLPERFDLVLHEARRTGIVVWRQWPYIGIKFVE
jgi:hypothetical protein